MPTLTAVQQVRELTGAETARGYPVHLRGVVTFHEPSWFLSFVQDATGGIYVRNFDPAVQVGTEVEVEGISEQGRSLPIIAGHDGGEAQVRLLGPGKWPQPIDATATLLGGDASDAQWVSVRGKVTAVARAHDGIMLDLLVDGVPLRAVAAQRLSVGRPPQRKRSGPARAGGHRSAMTLPASLDLTGGENFMACGVLFPHIPPL